MIMKNKIMVWGTGKKKERKKERGGDFISDEEDQRE